MIRRRIAHHFLPHFLVDAETVRNISDPHRVHHRAHALSLTSLFLYLQILILITIGIYTIRLKAPRILGTASFSSQQIIDLTNQKRTQNGLGPLTFNGLLAAAAEAKARDMIAFDYWAHNSPSGKTPWSFISAVGYRYVFAGENLARDFTDPGAVVDAWMNSPSHRENLLDKNFKEIGVAVESGKLTGRDGILVVQMFGAQVSQIPVQPVVAASPEPSPSASASTAPAFLNESPKPATPSLPIIVGQTKPAARPATVLASRQFSIAKAVSLGLVGFIFALFLLEIIVTLRRPNVYLRSGVIAHILLLGFLLLAVWYAVQGAIL